MTKGLADTSLFIARETGRTLDSKRVPEELAVSVVTAAELRAGVLMADEVAVRAARLRTLEFVRSLEPLPVDESVAEAWALLRVSLRDAGVRMKANDAWLAATALAHGLPVVTQDDDFDAVPGLSIIKV
jgi:predicted nucleic acid-binding protein